MAKIIPQRQKVIILGTGGHARVVIATLKALGCWEIVGLLDRKTGQTKELIKGYPVIGSWNDLGKVMGKEIRQAVIAVGDNAQREQLYVRLLQEQVAIPTVIHPTAYVDPSAVIGDGCLICMGTLIGANVKIGANTIVNSGTVIEHETIIGENAHIAPGCRIAGRVTVGRNSFIGIGTSVIDKIKIGKNATIGAGSVVVSDVLDDVVAYGVPAKRKERRKDSANGP